MANVEKMNITDIHSYLVLLVQIPKYWTCTEIKISDVTSWYFCVFN